MAKAPKRTTIAASEPLQSTWDDWMPLTAALRHIQQVVGGEQLAEEELRLRLASGDLEAQDRRVTPGERIDIVPLAPELFRSPHPLLFGHYEQGDSMLLDSIDLLRSHGHNFFVLRKHVHRLWPIAGEAKKPREAALPRNSAQGYWTQGMAYRQQGLGALA